MSFSKKLDDLHLWFRQNWWIWLFSIFTRIALSFAFIAAGFVKINGERFTDLHNKQPMGHYLQAVYETGYYYTFIGFMQLIAAILLLIPRTVLLGVLIYLPIILNICILSWSVRFEGSLFTSPLMVIACLFLMWWHYDSLKYILPFHRKSLSCVLPKQILHKKFPYLFFICVATTMIGVIFISATIFDVKPRNTQLNCNDQFKDGNRKIAGKAFCSCVHSEGQTLKKCLDEYFEAEDDAVIKLR